MAKRVKRDLKQSEEAIDSSVPSSDSKSSPPSKKSKTSPAAAAADDDARFIGKPVPADQARAKWPHRYESKNKVKVIASSNGELDGKEIIQAKCHYTKAVVDGIAFDLNDDAFVKAEEGKPDFIARIVEMFETVDRELYCSAQWFFRAEDTVIKSQAHLIDKRRVFYSDMKDDNPLDSIVSKVKIVQLSPNVDLAEKEKALSSFDLYYDMKYSMPVTFTTLHTEKSITESDESSVISGDASSDGVVEKSNKKAKSTEVKECVESQMTLLDLYSGCGAMSTGLCHGTNMSGVKLVTKWAVDINKHACESLKLNHTETEVRNEAAEDFLSLLKEWKNLCKEFCLLGSQHAEDTSIKSEESDSQEKEGNPDPSDGEFEVGKLLAVCYGDPNKVNNKKLHFKVFYFPIVVEVRWKGYGPSYDTWEPFDGLSNCTDAMKEFVSRGYQSRILPLPGDVDFICGGPPCQGISGHNRFRNYTDPLKDPKNHQLVVYMDIIEFLKPKFVLMENVCDIVKFADGILGYHAVGRLVSMNYQTRMGIMAAGSYGDCIVGSDNDKSYKLEKSILLGDAISDLPEVTNNNGKDEMEYAGAPRTSFQKYIRMRKQAVAKDASKRKMLYDHRPLELNEDDYARVCQIPKIKGANFRNLPGVMVGKNNKVEWDPSVERVMLPSGKPLVPNYAMTFVRGTSRKPFGRLSMDDIVTTVVGRAEPHNQVLLHPNQDRVLTIRENARLQGFPDHYKLSGPVKERYLQIGNAVSFSVSTALGYTLAKAVQGVCTSKPLTLPIKFPDCLGQSTVKQAPQESE
ncbi:Bromo adjacent homology (BAH) domain-containing protein [Cynara cardunculus var. scolymus]|uniref:DNA (cytosine-5-)-methyltransferase n=1 Tax=Cynara cardunculus var. scolymus TaxID=59895 RepID=A0A118JTP0_CYNCS|nr:Bromo adjacent homology (BAH) domain-containing protein [Cynara cardunculus var. scolymus]